MAKIVSKPWGHEEWISDGTTMPYALKRILFRAGHRSSLQVHRYKKETNYVLSGEGILIIGNRDFPIDDYLNGQLNSSTLEWYLEDFTEQVLGPGSSFNINPSTMHRVVAITDLTFIEASTPELDDVIRLQDDSRRGNGRIDSEHA